MKHAEPQGIARYQPLAVMLLMAALAAYALGAPYMERFMGVTFLLFAMLKLFDLSGFADGFSMYDLLTKRVRAYAFAYPFFELGLGLAYLAGHPPEWVLWATVGLMLLSAAGVVLALKRGLNLHCACMGTVLKVPLSTVSLVENVGMAAMAGWMLLA